MTKNFAHRGFSGKYPENTLLAFSKAIEEGVDGIENDVHLTKDGVLVVMHDELVDRTTNGKGYIKDKTYEELAQLDASYIFKEHGPQKVPTLREYLELVKDTDIITNIELKTGVFEYTGIEQKVYDMLREFDMVDRIIISSFNHYSVLRMKAIDPAIKCGMLEESWLINAGAYVASTGVECFHPFFKTHFLNRFLFMNASRLECLFKFNLFFCIVSKFKRIRIERVYFKIHNIPSTVFLHGLTVCL